MISRDLITECCEIFAIHPRDLLGDYRFRFIARPRQALYLALRMRGWSYPRIGKLLNRDHSTVIYGAKQADWLMSRDPEYAAKIQHLASMKVKPIDPKLLEKGEEQCEE